MTGRPILNHKAVTTTQVSDFMNLVTDFRADVTKEIN